MNIIRIITLLLVALASGCQLQSYSQEPTDYYLNPDKNLADVGRITLVELENNSSYPKISADTTNAIFQELQKKQIFGLTVLKRSDPMVANLQLNSSTIFTLEQLSAMKKTLCCNAILIGTVTDFKPYPHTSIGLRLKLIDLTDGQMLWAIEQIWDGRDVATKKRIDNYYNQGLIESFKRQDKLGSISPLKFIRFVSYEITDTFVAKQ
ncbi:MAG: hypothetical protein K8R02_04450 [Anaerohalosphaeraceae bacterium]|nr:hypothetical protein [Anaerohalosphaeraceae bacterium]